MSRNARLIASLIVLLAGGYVGIRALMVDRADVDSTVRDENDAVTLDGESSSVDDFMVSFGDAVEVPHFVASTPNHTDSMGAAPVNIVIDTDLALASASTLSITNSSTDYGTGETTLDTGAKAMRRTMKPDAPNGVYRVTYTACWTEGNCDDGAFSFEIDRTLADYYEDVRGKSDVAVTASDLTFDPIEIRINKGTKVTWTNNETALHTVSSDPDPSKSYFSALDSPALKKGEAYSYTFTAAGYYPYHDSKNPDDMVGTIVVE